jgi:hypothetical protein
VIRTFLLLPLLVLGSAACIADGVVAIAELLRSDPKRPQRKPGAA